MSAIIEQIKADRTNAMKNKNTIRLSILRMLLSTFDTERGKTGKDLTDDQVLSLIGRVKNNLDEEIKSLQDAGRDATTQVEQLRVVMDYLPEQLSEDEVQGIIMDTILKNDVDFGQIMKILSAQLKGKTDMKYVSAFAKRVFNEK